MWTPADHVFTLFLFSEYLENSTCFWLWKLIAMDEVDGLVIFQLTYFS